MAIFDTLFYFFVAAKPDDYNDPDEYADYAWDLDFDSYDEAYDYWRNW